MKQCPFCKAELDDEARFCLYCMTSLDEKQNVGFAAPKGKRWQGILAAALVLVLVAGWVLFFPPTAVPTGETKPSAPAAHTPSTTALRVLGRPSSTESTSTTSGWETFPAAESTSYATVTTTAAVIAASTATTETTAAAGTAAVPQTTEPVVTTAVSTTTTTEPTVTTTQAAVTTTQPTTTVRVNRRTTNTRLPTTASQVTATTATTTTTTTTTTTVKPTTTTAKPTTTTKAPYTTVTATYTAPTIPATATIQENPDWFSVGEVVHPVAVSHPYEEVKDRDVIVTDVVTYSLYNPATQADEYFLMVTIYNPNPDCWIQWWDVFVFVKGVDEAAPEIYTNKKVDPLGYATEIVQIDGVLGAPESMLYYEISIQMIGCWV